MIIKCQRQQNSGDGARWMLLYSSCGSYEGEFALTEDWSRHFDNLGEKFFAEIDANDFPPKFLGQKPEQDW
jgi:hypothetical protein